MFRHIDLSTVKVLVGISGLAGSFLIWIIKEKEDLLRKATTAFMLLSAATIFFWFATIILLMALILYPSVYWINDLGFTFVFLGAILATLALADPFETFIAFIRFRLYEWGIKRKRVC